MSGYEAELYRLADEGQRRTPIYAARDLLARNPVREPEGYLSALAAMCCLLLGVPVHVFRDRMIAVLTMPDDQDSGVVDALDEITSEADVWVLRNKL